MTTPVRYVLSVAALGAAIYSLVLARAEYLFEEDSGPSIAKAATLVPYNSQYLSRLAPFQPSRRRELLTAAVRMNPFDSTAWLQLGLNEEIRNNDSNAAEADYLQAARVDHMFLPSWTLANFYFRQGRPTEFFFWAKKALAITPYSCEPIFGEMWLLDARPDVFIRYVPDRPAALVQAISFLAYRQEYGGIPALGRRLVQGPRSTVTFRQQAFDDTLGPALDMLLRAGDVTRALELWTSLSAAKWVPLGAPSGSQPINNGDFRSPVLGHGFDWTLQSGEGYSVFQNEAAASLTVSFTGNQAEQLVLVRQWIPLTPGRIYRMAWHSSAERLQDEAGITWHIHGRATELRSPDVVGSKLGSWQFTHKEPDDGALLTLEYSRPLGQTRAEGSLTMQNVSMFGH